MKGRCKKKWALPIAGSLAAVILLIVAISGSSGQSKSYQNGYQYGQNDLQPDQTGPNEACGGSSQFPPSGMSDYPNDDVNQWQAGCVDGWNYAASHGGAKAVVGSGPSVAVQSAYNDLILAQDKVSTIESACPPLNTDGSGPTPCIEGGYSTEGKAYGTFAAGIRKVKVPANAEATKAHLIEAANQQKITCASVASNTQYYVYPRDYEQQKLLVQEIEQALVALLRGQTVDPSATSTTIPPGQRQSPPQTYYSGSGSSPSTTSTTQTVPPTTVASATSGDPAAMAANIYCTGLAGSSRLPESVPNPQPSSTTHCGFVPGTAKVSSFDANYVYVTVYSLDANGRPSSDPLSAIVNIGTSTILETGESLSSCTPGDVPLNTRFVPNAVLASLGLPSC